jgi:hypothetical protein
MIDPEQAEFRRLLRSRIRPVEEPDDEDWTPRPRWDDMKRPKRKPGPPPSPTPTANNLAVRRYREKIKRLRQAEADSPVSQPDGA